MRLFFKNNYLLHILLLVTLLKGAVWAAAVPLFQAPDEQFHYATVQYYAVPKEYRPLPENFPSRVADDISTQNISPELRSFLEKTDFYKIRWKPDNRMVFAENSAFGIGEQDLRNNKPSPFVDRFPPWIIESYGPAYYKSMGFVEKMLSGQSIMERVFAIRLFSAFLGTLLVLCAYFIFRELFLNKAESVMLAGVVSFQPALTAVNASINVDPLLFLAFALFTLGSVRILRNKTGAGTLIFLVAGTVLGIHIKPPGYLMAAMLPILAFFWLRLHQGERLGSYSRKTKFFGAMILAAALLGAVYVALGKYLAGLLKIAPLVPKYVAYELTYGPTFGRLLSYWGCFGWVDTKLPRFFIFSIGALLAVSVLGIVKYFIREWRQRSSEKTADDRIFFQQILYFLLFAAGLSLAIHAVNLLYANPHDVADQSQSIGLQGRYFFPAIIPQMALLAFGFVFLFSKVRRCWIFLLLLTAMAFLNFWSLFDVIIPRYYL